MQTHDNLGGFNARRKRQIDLSRARNMKLENMTGIKWGDEVDTTTEDFEFKSVRKIEKTDPVQTSDFTKQESKHLFVVSQVDADERTALFLDGKPINFRGKEREKTFEESHIRFTSYLESDLFYVIQALKKQGRIHSIKELVNESVKHYLTCSDV